MPMEERSVTTTQTSTAKVFRAITPSDTVEYDFRLKGLYVTAGGDLNLRDHNDTVTTFPGVVAGQVIYVRPKQVLETGTTAAVIGLWE